MRKLNTKPNFTTEVNMMFNAVKTIDNAFLQGLVNLGAIVIADRTGFSVMAFNSYVFFLINEESVVLECISTPVDERGKGSGTKFLKVICEVAKATCTNITLRACDVTINSFMMPPFAIAHGAKKKGKIPVKDLPKWYEKFGFEKVKSPGKQKGVFMELYCALT